MQDQTHSTNRLTEEHIECSRILQNAKENPQEPRHLRSRSRKAEKHNNAKDSFIAPRSSIRKKS